MSNISQSGSFRGIVIDRGLSESSGGFLQLILTLQATERYDEDNQVWTPFNYEDCEAQAYLNLITSKDKENPVNCRQIMRAFGWDGMSWAALNDTENGLAKQIQWRMGMETYNDMERCRVQGIDAYDAAPGRKVEKLDAAKVRALDAKYAGILKKLGGGPKPVTAKPAAPPQAPVSPDPTPAPAPTPSITPAPSAATPEPPAPPKKRGRPATPKAAPPVAAAAPLSQEDAWGAYADKAQAAGKTDLEIQNKWIEVVNERGGDEAVGADWSGVVAECCARLGL
jgi:hypothetical protein